MEKEIIILILIKIEIMLKSIIKTVLLVLAIAFIATSIKEPSFIHAFIGCICAGIYNNIED